MRQLKTAERNKKGRFLLFLYDKCIYLKRFDTF